MPPKILTLIDLRVDPCSPKTLTLTLIARARAATQNRARSMSPRAWAMPNENVFIDIIRDGDLIRLPLKIGSSKDVDGNEIGIMGITFGTSRSFLESISKGAYETYNLSIKTLQFIGKMLTGNMGTEDI